MLELSLDTVCLVHRHVTHSKKSRLTPVIKEPCETLKRPANICHGCTSYKHTHTHYTLTNTHTHTGGTILGSSRGNNPNEHMEKIMDRLLAEGVNQACVCVCVCVRVCVCVCDMINWQRA